jgi:hypothetical protein
VIRALIIFTLAFVCLWWTFAFNPSFVHAGDLRTAKLARYLAARNSPLAHSAPTFVAEADRNGLDYRLLVAISGIESGFGRAYIRPTHNVWGWGGGKLAFNSFDEGIAVVSEGLRKNYLNRGAVEIEHIGRIYCPPCNAKWPNAVRKTMAEIEAVDISDLVVETEDRSIYLTLTI